MLKREKLNYQKRIKPTFNTVHKVYADIIV